MSEEYKSNSNKSRNLPERRVEKPIVSGTTIRKKTSLRTFADKMLSDDIDSLKTYIVQDIALPLIRNAIHDIITGSADRIFGRGDNRRSSTAASKINYRNYYDEREDPRDYRPSYNRSVYEYDEVLLPDRGSAEVTLDAMKDMLAHYRQVRVADLYDLAGCNIPHTAWDYIWTDLSTAHVERVGNKYRIVLPRPFPIDR